MGMMNVLIIIGGKSSGYFWL